MTRCSRFLCTLRRTMYLFLVLELSCRPTSTWIGGCFHRNVDLPCYLEAWTESGRTMYLLMLRSSTSWIPRLKEFQEVIVKIMYLLTPKFSKIYPYVTMYHRDVFPSLVLDEFPEVRETSAMYLLTPSIFSWNSVRSAFILEMMLPTLPMMVANTRTATRNSMTTKMYSKTVVGCGTSPIIASVSVDQ